jgi:hypothetical protein
MKSLIFERLYSTADATEIKDVRKREHRSEVIYTVKRWCREWNKQSVRRNLWWQDFRHHCYIYEKDCGIISYSYLLSEPVARIYNIIVNPCKLNTGIANRLLSKLLFIVNRRNIVAIRWNIKAEDNLFFDWAESVGFVKGKTKIVLGHEHIQYVEFEMKLKEKQENKNE